MKSYVGNLYVHVCYRDIPPNINLLKRKKDIVFIFVGNLLKPILTLSHTHTYIHRDIVYQCFCGGVSAWFLNRNSFLHKGSFYIVRRQINASRVQPQSAARRSPYVHKNLNSSVSRRSHVDGCSATARVCPASRRRATASPASGIAPNRDPVDVG